MDTSYATPVALVAAGLALAGGAAILLAVRQRVGRNCAERRAIMDRRGPLEHIALDAGRRLTAFTAAPALVGAAYGDNEDVAKMFARAQTGGGFVPFTFVRDGAVVRVLFYVEMDDAGGVRGRGKVGV